jgi:hypothetical protein
MEFVDLFDPPSWAKVIVGTVVYFGLGAVWYNPKVFGSAWLKESGANPDDEAAKARMPMIFGLTAAMAFVAMLVLVRLVPPGLELATAIQAALILGLAFILPIAGMNALYEGKSARYFGINYGYHQVGILLAAVIFAVWK